MKSKAIVIVGPTCTGKTSLAVNLCRQFNGSVISADSRQVVKYMDVGTGKLPIEETGSRVEILDDRWVVDGIDVFGYDLVDPDRYFSAFDFAGFCKKIVPRIFGDGKSIMLAGGTGFYVDAVTGRVALGGIGPDLDFRRSLEALSLGELGQRLKEADGEVYRNVDLKNPVRLVRALEKLERAKHFKPISKDLTEDSPIQTLLYIGLTSDRNTLYARADRWVETVFNERIFNEVEMVKARFPGSHRLKGLVYKGAVGYLEGRLSLEEAKQQAKFDMHAYIRRQQTWFKRNPLIKWFDISQKNFDGGIFSIVESVLNG